MHPYLFVPSIFLLANPVIGDWQTSSDIPVHVGDTLLRVINHRMVSSRYARIDDFAVKTIADDFLRSEATGHGSTAMNIFAGSVRKRSRWKYIMTMSGCRVSVMPG